jgi:hypothetical protein
MRNINPDELKRIRSYALAAIPFIALFAYELATLFSHRPAMPDLMHGYTIALGSDNSDKRVYVSAGDLTLLFGPFLCAFVIMTIGAWRAGLFRQFLRP